MQVLRLLAARRQRCAVSTITAAHYSSEVPADSEVEEDDDGPFFDLDLASSLRASSSSISSSDESSDDASYSSELDDFIISLHRSRSASPSASYRHDLFCASEPSTKAGRGLVLQQQEQQYFKPRQGKGTTTYNNLGTLSFGVVGANLSKKKSSKAAAKKSFYGGRPSFASSTRSSLRLFMESPLEDDVKASEEPTTKQSGDVIRRCLTKISRRLRSVRPRPPSSIGDARDRRLRKSRSASAAVTLQVQDSRRDDSLVEKQDAIASAIAHCKESFRRASLSECDSSLLRSRSDPGKC